MYIMFYYIIFFAYFLKIYGKKTYTKFSCIFDHFHEVTKLINFEWLDGASM